MRLASNRGPISEGSEAAAYNPDSGVTEPRGVPGPADARPSDAGQPPRVPGLRDYYRDVLEQEDGAGDGDAEDAAFTQKELAFQNLFKSATSLLRQLSEGSLILGDGPMPQPGS